VLITVSYSITVIPNCEGQVAIVTGGNKGIGYETVKGLCKAHMTVIMGKQICWIQHDSSSLFKRYISQRFCKNMTARFSNLAGGGVLC